jgi:hypothetical protein
MDRSPFPGADGRTELYHLRHRQALEVDFLFPHGGEVWVVECKVSKTGREPRAAVAHRASSTAPPTRALVPGIQALDLAQFVQDLNRGNR